jgi:flagellar protein FlbB
VRIFILFLLLVVLTLGGVVWFDYLGLVDARSAIAPVYRLLGLQKRSAVASADDPNLLEKERLAKQQDAIALRAQDLDSRQAALDKREQELTQLGQQLNEKESALNAQQKALSDQQKAIEDRRVNLVKNADYLTSMPPAKAVAILEKQDDQFVIDTFRIVDDQAAQTGVDSLVPVWLQLLPPDRAATLQRKMAGDTTSPQGTAAGG